MDRPDASLRRRSARAKLVSALVFLLFFATCAVVQLAAPDGLAEIGPKTASDVRHWLLLLVFAALGIILPALTCIRRKRLVRKKGR
ncbi:cytochrome bd-type quinol oxidase subunit 2 [Bradyrhizobium sp. AZCC 2262]|uniref:hypothetical protein n=1 Tax=Bradyrhizobium sp. AZCC 2262 TaxID=3117022 RepID=UPI002FF0674A